MLAAGGAGAQQSPFFTRKPPPPAPAPEAPVVARVQGRPITQRDFDRVAQPYYERLREQLKQGFTAEMQKLAAHGVLSELVRRQVMLIEAERRGIRVTEAETDRYLSQDPFFLTNGTFDRQKFVQFKLDPNSNYATILPRIREQVIVTKLDSTLRAQFTPSTAALRAEWTRRSGQVRFRFLALGLRDMSLEPQASETEQAAYYAAHPEVFERRGRARLRYLRLPLPAEGDSQRAAARDSALRRAQGWADSLRRGTSIDSVAVGAGGVLDTGLFDLPAAAIPGLGAAPRLASAIAGADSDTTIRVVGPLETPDAVVVAQVVERSRRGVPSMPEILSDVKRRADVEKRRTTAEADARAYYESHRSEYRAPQATVTRVLLPETTVAVPPRPPKDIEAWYATHGPTGRPPGDSARVAPPALNDSLRAAVRAQLLHEDRAVKATATLRRLADLWRAGRDLRSVSRPTGARVESRTIVSGVHDDSIFPPPVIDSLFLDRSGPGPGPIHGPRSFGRLHALWRIEGVDSAFVLPFEVVRPRIDAVLAESKRAAEEAEAGAYFDRHRSQYKTPTRYVVDYIAVRPPPPDSVEVSDLEIQKDYGTQPADFRQEEQVRARHILIAPDLTLANADARARARIDSVARALRDGADFEDLARRLSQDPGSAARGGDLGFFARGRMVKAFSDTAFSLAVGRVSRPVRTHFGYHLIRVDERHPAELRPLDEVRSSIRRRLAVAIADSAASRRARILRREIGRGRDPAILAAASGGVVRSPRFALEAPVPGLGFSPELAQALARLPLGSWTPAVYRIAGAYVLVRPARREPATQAEFEDVRAEALRDTKNAKREELLAQTVAGIRARLGAGASLDSVAAAHGGLKDSGLIGGSPGFVPALGVEPHLVARALSLAPGTTSDTVSTNQGVAWVRVEEKKTLPGGSFEKDRSAIAQDLVTKKYNDWVEAKKKASKIEILRADLREAPLPVIEPVPVGQGR
ncbi:MAG TPA: peptidyl-prolyl cis-trans isomerase [Candidatus Eisenbacteria bacterium]